jgi:hypothetical protein
MSEAFRDISPEAPELQPIISGLFAEYAARYGDYFSRDAEVELSEWYRRRRGCLLSLSVRVKLSPPARISRRIATPRRSNVSGRTAVCASRAGGEGGPGAGATGGAGRVQPYLPDHRFPSAGGGKALSQPGYEAQFDLTRDPEEYSQPPYDGRLRFTKALAVSAYSHSA